MMHKVRVKVPVTKRGLFGRKKTVYQWRTLRVDAKTYNKLMRRNKNRPFTVEEMMIYDDLFDDE